MEWSGHEEFGEEFRDALTKRSESEVARGKRAEHQMTGEILVPPGLVPEWQAPMKIATVHAHTKAASTCYRLDPPGSNPLGSLFCVTLTGYVNRLSAIYRVFIFLFCLVSSVDTHSRFNSSCIMRVDVFNLFPFLL